MSEMIYDQPAIEQMIEILNRSAQELDAVKGKMHDLARMVTDGDEGALVGEGGDALFQAINNTLTDRIDRLSVKLKERADFVQRELEQHLQAVQGNQQRFR